jgi:hypothetical protein
MPASQAINISGGNRTSINFGVYPVITSITPISQPAGIFNLTINGRNFGLGTDDRIYWKADNHYVGSGGTVSSNPTQLISNESMTVPGVYVVKVVNSDGLESNGLDLSITPVLPIISSISPAFHEPGTFNVVIYGTYFSNTQTVGVYNADTGTLVGNTGFVVDSSGGQITATVNVLPGRYYFRVTTYSGTSNNSSVFNVDSVQYQGHFANTGWMSSWAKDGQTAGSPGGNQMEAIKITLGYYGVQYRAHVANDGWLPWVSNGAIAGTTGQAKSLQAIEIKLMNAPANLHVQYRAYVEGLGWQSWVSDGATAGTTGQGRAIQAIEIKIQSN